MAEQAVEQVVGQREDAVVLEYGHQRKEMTEAVRLMLRKQGGTGLLHHPVLLVRVGAAGAVQLVMGVIGDQGAGFAFGPGRVVWTLLTSRVPGPTARRPLRANRHHGLMRVTVAEQDVRVVSVPTGTRMAWAGFGGHAETGRCSVLRSPDRAGTRAMVLAKRGARTRRTWTGRGPRWTAARPGSEPQLPAAAHSAQVPKISTVWATLT